MNDYIRCNCGALLPKDCDVNADFCRRCEHICDKCVAESEQAYQNSLLDVDRRESELAEMEGGDFS